MAWIKIAGDVPQVTISGEQANGYVAKFYEAGTTTPLTMSTNTTGSPTTVEFITDTQGFFTLSGSRVIPHTQSDYKIVLYENQTDADANDTGSAVYVADNIQGTAVPDGSIGLTQLLTLDSGKFIIGGASANAQYAITGDITITALGVATIQANAVEESMLATALSSKITSSIFDIKSGLTLSNNASDAVNDIDAAAGYASDSTNTAIMTLSTTTTTSIDLNIGTGTGGRPSAVSLTNDTWYRVFLVSEADGTNPKLVFDTDASATNALSDCTAQFSGTYTLFRRIGWVYYGTATIDGFTQKGDRFIWDVQKNNGTSVAFSTSRTARTVTCPPSTLSQVQIKAKRAGTGETYIMITGDGQADSAPTSSIYNMIAIRWGSAPEESPIITFDLVTTSSSQIYYRCSDVPSGDLLDFFAVGWTDFFDN